MQEILEDFNFFLPLSKADSKVDAKGRRVIQGIASTEDVDLQGETVKLAGLDTSYFMKHGFFNNDHRKEPTDRIGEPTEIKITKAGLWVKGFLYVDNPEADKWWILINSLVNSDANRKVGFSIEGKVTRRQGNSILKAWIQNIAITASPVNTSTWLEIVKSLSGEKFCDTPWKDDCTCCKDNSCACKTHAIEPEEKALTASGMGRSLIPQSLEGSNKIQTYKSLESLTKEEAVDMLILEKGYSKSTAKLIAESIFRQNGIF